MRGLALRALASLVVVGLLVGAALLRLARVPRPEARVIARYAGGAVSLERVTVGRRVLGHGVRCGGVLVLERFGEAPPRVTEGAGGVVVDDRGCRVTVTAAGCRAARAPGCGGR